MEYLYVFLTGGVICAIGQILMDTTKLTAPRILVIFVVSGAILQGLHIYEHLINFGHQGASVPLPGFGALLAKGAMKGAKEGFLGAITGAVRESSAGIAVAIAFGYIISLIFNPKTKK